MSKIFNPNYLNESQQVQKNKEDIEYLLNNQWQIWTSNATFTEETNIISVLDIQGAVNIPETYKNALIIDRGGNLFRGVGYDDLKVYVSFVCNLKGPKGDDGETPAVESGTFVLDVSNNVMRIAKFKGSESINVDMDEDDPEAFNFRLDHELINQINKALVIPLVVPSEQVLVSIDTNNAQTNLKVGSGLSIVEGALVASDSGSSVDLEGRVITEGLTQSKFYYDSSTQQEVLELGNESVTTDKTILKSRSLEMTDAISTTTKLDGNKIELVDSGHLRKLIIAPERIETTYMSTSSRQFALSTGGLDFTSSTAYVNTGSNKVQIKNIPAKMTSNEMDSISALNVYDGQVIICSEENPLGGGYTAGHIYRVEGTPGNYSLVDITPSGSGSTSTLYKHNITFYFDNGSTTDLMGGEVNFEIYNYDANPFSLDESWTLGTQKYHASGYEQQQSTENKWLIFKMFTIESNQTIQFTEICVAGPSLGAFRNNIWAKEGNNLNLNDQVIEIQ